MRPTLLYIVLFIVPCRLSTDLKIHDLEWLNVQFTLNFHYYELTLRVLLAGFENICYLFTVESVNIRVTSDVGSGVTDRDLAESINK